MSRGGRAVDPTEPGSTAARGDSVVDGVTAVDHPEEDRTGLTGAPDPHVDDEDQATTRDREVHRTLVADRRRDPMKDRAGSWHAKCWRPCAPCRPTSSGPG